LSGLAAARSGQQKHKPSSAAKAQQQPATASQQTGSEGSYSKASAASATTALPVDGGSSRQAHSDQQQQQQQAPAQLWRNQQRQDQQLEADSRGNAGLSWQQVRRRLLSLCSRQPSQRQLRRRLQQAAQWMGVGTAEQSAGRRAAGGSTQHAADEVRYNSSGGRKLVQHACMRMQVPCQRCSWGCLYEYACDSGSPCRLRGPMWRCSLQSRRHPARRRLQTSSTAYLSSTKCEPTGSHSMLCPPGSYCGARSGSSMQ
jgi:hypothetical protein